MSLQDQAAKCIERASTLIQAGNPQVASEELRQAILYSPKNAGAYLLLGVALSQMGHAAESETAFRRAIQLDDASPKARYNLAVHQYAQGEMRNALATAREAIEADPSHARSKELVERIEQELGLEPGALPATTPAGNPNPLQPRPGYEPNQTTAMPMVERLGPVWVAFGWLIAFLSFAGLALTLNAAAPHFNSNLNAQALMNAIQTMPGYTFLQALHFSSVILAIVWISVDAIHRGGNLFWLLPQAICGCVGFTWIVVPLYILLGRPKLETGADSQP